ncbi:MAG: rod shape-determining protein MreD [Tannerellaceae bacterium]|jgi:rod shape-determining protein MreD|nr:rod shape-determining protein MreD [Tannerellaceae bacterium]
MVNRVSSSVFVFVFCVALQAFIFSQVYILRVITPFFYLYFLLKLPFGLARSYVLLLGFLIGWVIDLFGNTSGMHAAACTVAGFVRPYIISGLFEKNLPDESIPSYQNFGYKRFILYVLFFVSVHHVTLAIVESVAFPSLGFFCLRIFINTIVTASVLCVAELFSLKKKIDDDDMDLP